MLDISLLVKLILRYCVVLSSFQVNMIMSQKLKVAFREPASMAGYKSIESYLQSKNDPDIRIGRMIADGMNFDFEAVTYNSENKLHSNGSWTGAIGLINRSEVDIVPELFVINEQRMDAVDFIYPFRLYSSVFIIKRREYTPQIFGIVKPFTLNIWITLILFTIAMVGLEAKLMKHKFVLFDVLFNAIAICFNQGAILNPRTLSHNLLTCNWMVGTMFLGFGYMSVLLSYLTFPPVHQIRTVQDLAKAVENEGYKCMIDSYSAVGAVVMSESHLKYMAIIGKSILANPSGSGKINDFLRMKKEKIAYFNIIERIPFLPEDYYFVSEEGAMEGPAALIVRKTFCCKERLDMVIHRIMAAGLHAKVKQDTAFLFGLKLDHSDAEIATLRKLTLENFLLAFAILLFGQVSSLAVLVVEVMFYCLKNRNHEIRKKNKIVDINAEYQKN